MINPQKKYLWITEPANGIDKVIALMVVKPVNFL